MVVACARDVWREISNYFEGDVDPALREALEQHLARSVFLRCQSVRDGMFNVIELYGEKTMFPLPVGFYPRLHSRLANEVEGRRISRRAWLVSVGVTGAVFAASAVLRGGALGRFDAAPALRDEPAGAAIAAKPRCDR